MRIDFILDIGCLWSYIAWHQLQTALKEYSFPYEIKPFFVSSERFFPGFSMNPAERTKLLEKRAAPFLEQAELRICFEKLPHAVQDLTLAARLADDAFKKHKGNDVLTAIFEAFFMHGENISDPDVLIEIARRHQLSLEFLTQERSCVFPNSLKTDPMRAVPCLIFDQKTMIFGAQSVSCLKNMLSLAVCLKKEKTFE